MAVRVSLVFHEGSEIEANAARLLEDRPRRAGLTKSQYIARCIVAAEEGGLATLSVDQVRALIRESTAPKAKTGFRDYDDL